LTEQIRYLPKYKQLFFKQNKDLIILIFFQLKSKPSVLDVVDIQIDEVCIKVKCFG